MKKIFCLFIALLLAFTCIGCTETEEHNNAENEFETDEKNDAAFRRTVLYYATEDGFVVPVMKKIPWEEGIGKAALSYLQSSYDNDVSASKLGILTVIPEGASIELSIENDNAQVTLNNLPEQTEKEQKLMITAIVNTLTEFASIDTVSIIADGKTILKETSKLVLNVEDSDINVSSGNAKRMTLYFPNKQASLNVPVTRYTNGENGFEGAVRELLKGPENNGLLNAFPEGTTLNSATVYDNKAVVDLSEEFLSVSETDGLLTACYECLYLTASEYGVIYDVELRVNGETYNLESVSVFAPIYANEF